MRRDWHDIWGGAAMAAIGAAVAFYAMGQYEFGTLRRMGPGFFPTVLGALLAGLGLMIALPAWRRSGEARPFAAHEALAVLAAIALFGLGLQRLGLMPTTAVAGLVASLPAPRRGWRWRVMLAVAIAALTWLVFKEGLQMTMPVWPRLGT